MAYQSKLNAIKDMNQLNKIEPQHIERLGADQLVRLLNLLLHAEAKDRCLNTHGIHVPFQITVPDGGRDGRWNAEIGNYEYIPRALTYFQCKAQYMTDSDCQGEILREDADGKASNAAKEVNELASMPCGISTGVIRRRVFVQ